MAQVNPQNLPASEPESCGPHRQTGLTGPLRLVADLLALVYIGLIAAVASLTGAFYVLFPELAALSSDVMGRPSGRWASAPILLALTPTLTGLIGTVVTRTMPYGFVSVLVTVAGSIAIIIALRSPVAPAISAGLLPLVLGVTSWWYPPGILFGSTLLAVISIPWKRYAISAEVLNLEQTGQSETLDRAKLAHPPEEASGTHGAPRAGLAPREILSLMVFVAVAVGAVKLTGMRFILFPPLVVILFEMLCHPDGCPWLRRTAHLPLACFLAAAGGYFFHAHIAFAPLAAMLSMAWGIAVLRKLDVHVPPALAVALLPMVMDRPTIGYPFAAGIGTTLASVWFVTHQKWIGQHT